MLTEEQLELVKADLNNKIRISESIENHGFDETVRDVYEQLKNVYGKTEIRSKVMKLPKQDCKKTLTRVVKNMIKKRDNKEEVVEVLQGILDNLNK